jgi:hypothetical protein
MNMLAACVERAPNRWPKLRSEWRGGAVEIVLGVSMTPTAVRMAVVEGERADGAIVEHDVFDITATDGAAMSSASDQVIAAVLGTQEGALAAGHHLVSTGVSWSDRAEAAVLREALVARGLEDVLLVSELHAAAALAQAVGRAVGYDKTALMFIERDTATLAVVETIDGSVVKVLSQTLHNADAIAVLTEMVASLEAQESVPQGMFVVGSSVDVTAVKAHLKNLLSVPVIAPEQPGLALARGAALASANAPRYDTSTIGLAYSQDPDGALAMAGDATMLLGNDATMLLGNDATMLIGYDATTLLGHEDAFADAADIASDSDDVQEGGKPFLLVGSSLTAIFAAGVVGLAITLAVNIEPTVDRGPGEITVPPNAAAPTLGVQSAPPAAPPPEPRAVPEPAPSAAPPAPTVRARLLKAPPAPARPPVLVPNEAPAPAARPPAPARPPPVVAPPVVAPAPVIQLPFLPPVVLPPPFYSPPVEGPRWYPAPKKPPWGHGGGRGGGHGRGDHDD